jgi:copper chaperone CopZ
MKYLKISLAVLVVALFATPAFSQSCHSNNAKAGETEAASSASILENVPTDFEAGQFIVGGECGMCKRTIEGAVNSLTGIQAVNWDVESKMLTVSYNPKALTVQTIQEKIASVGYDAGTVQATDEAYNNLHGCCQYERVKL